MQINKERYDNLSDSEKVIFSEMNKYIREQQQYLNKVNMILTGTSTEIKKDENIKLYSVKKEKFIKRFLKKMFGLHNDKKLSLPLSKSDYNKLSFKEKMRRKLFSFIDKL